MRNINFKSALISFAVAFSVAFLITSISSCGKEDPTLAKITVNYADGTKVEGAKVILSREGEINSQGSISDVFEKMDTDQNGQAQFEFQYEAILDVIVEKVDGNSTYSGQSVVRLLRNKIVFKTVVVTED